MSGSYQNRSCITEKRVDQGPHLRRGRRGGAGKHPRPTSSKVVVAVWWCQLHRLLVKVEVESAASVNIQKNVGLGRRRQDPWRLM